LALHWDKGKIFHLLLTLCTKGDEMKKKKSLLLVAFSLLVAASCLAAEPHEVLTPALKGKLADEAKLAFQVIDEKSLLVSVKDAENNPVRGLKAEDFVLQSGNKKARILSVEPLETSESVPLNIVLVVDNSASMKKRRAIKPLMAALDEFFKTLRPIDNVSVVVFSKKEGMQVKGYNLHTKSYRSKSILDLKAFIDDAFDDGLTSQTFLYEAMVAGISIIRKMPENATKFLVVFSDGEDINSAFKTNVVEAEAKGIKNLEVFAVDYMPGEKLDKFLTSFADAHGGRVWKATSAAELLPIFKSFSTTLLYRYVVNYQFPDPPKGTVAIQPARLTIEEVTTIDSSPLLNYVFFETGQSDLPSRYATFSNQADTKAFNKSRLKGTMEKYTHVLDIIGGRLRANPEAHIKIVGCNSNRGDEHNRKDLSRSRAESVRAYLKYIWGIESSRMELEARNLPAVASASSVDAGRAENQRVEIYSESPVLLDTIKSTYVEKISNAQEVRVLPQIQSGYDLDHWTVALVGDGTLIDSTTGQGDLMSAYQFNLQDIGLGRIGGYENIEANIEVEDKTGQTYTTHASISVRFIRREERVAKKEGYKVMEKYALILFDFNRADIKDRNRAVVDRIVTRIKEVPTARVRIEGHTDSIGKEAYNMDLSQRRAKAAFDMILSGGAIGSGDISYEGVGPHNPLFDNEVPEGRALNRTVTVTLEYEQQN